MLSPVSIGLYACKPSQCLSSYPSQLSLAITKFRCNEYQKNLVHPQYIMQHPRSHDRRRHVQQLEKQRQVPAPRVHMADEVRYFF